MISDIPVRSEVIKLQVESPMDNFRAETYSTKEPETLDWIDSCVRPGNVFYDLGANNGLYTLYAAKALRGQGAVLAFEPESQNYARLNQHIFLNGVGNVATAYCAAVSDRLSVDLLNIHPYCYNLFEGTQGLMSGTAMHTVGDALDDFGQPFTPTFRQGTVTLSIDELWGSFGLPMPTHVKIDVDGMERKILMGMARTLARPELRSVLIEVTPNDEERGFVYSTLEGHGFKPLKDLEDISRRAMGDGQFKGFYNAVFLR